MPTVELNGHHEKNGVSELLRLFFGAAEETSSGALLGGSAQPLITSSITYLPDGGSRVETACTWTDRRQNDLPDAMIRLLPQGAVGIRPHPLARREVKRQLYEQLSRLTGQKFPYGSLTGICPTRLAAQALAQTIAATDARNYLESEFGVAPVKSALLVETAIHEQAILSTIDESAVLVYVNIPFCPTRCSYCSFICETAGDRQIDLDAYVTALIAEANALAPHLRQAVSALYIGGGTPTTLSADQLKRLLHGLFSALQIHPDTEITVEAGRPDTIDPEKLQVIHAAGVQRICVNPQTMHDRTLAVIGRRHTSADTWQALTQARAAGFAVINTDLIAGLPGESPADFLESLRMILDWGPENITIHTLSKKRKSKLFRDNLENGAQADLHDNTEVKSVRLAEKILKEEAAITTECADDWSDALDQAHTFLTTAGYQPYYLYRQKDTVGGLENTGYAKPGTACRYNVGMMSDERPVIGIGAGAMSKYIDPEGCLKRLPAPRDLKTYLQNREMAVIKKIRLFFATTS